MPQPFSSTPPHISPYLLAASPRCGAARETTERRAGGRTQEQHALLIGDPHPPDRTRVNQALQNQPAFARAFGCDVGAPLNPGPSEECSVW